MVTVITTKEELPTPINNGVTGVDSSDNQRLSQLIKDYQEVDFHRSSSCKPLPEDIIHGQISINGTFLVQIDVIEKEPNSDRILLTITDGIIVVQAILNDQIPNLNFNTRIGSKLLLNDSIEIIDGVLQLTHDNTRFQYGSNTYPRPRSAHRGRASGFNRSSHDGRRPNRYDTDEGETKILKRPPPKNTLMDFMTSLKISNDTENDKPKERPRRSNDGINSTYYNDHIIFQQDGVDEQLDPEDDPSHVNYRERRNPLPPRLQRAQEERTRRNTNRYDERTDPNSTHLAYFQTNPNPLTYISSSTFHNQQPLIASSYPNDHITFCYGTPYANPTYLPSTVGNGNTKISSDNENDENNDSGIKLESSITDNQEEKQRDSNPRPRWKIGDMCLARWSEDREFYPAIITDIHPPYCTVIFRDYNNYDQVHFNDLKVVPRDQPFYQFIPPSSDLNILTTNPYYQPRTGYYPSTIDGCVIMPEAPPFPFNSAGTLYIYPPNITSIPHANGYQQEIPRNDYTSPSKDSNNTSGIDSTTISSNDDNQQQDTSVTRPCTIADTPLTQIPSDDNKQQDDTSMPRPCSVADAPLTLVSSDDDKQQQDVSIPRPCSIADTPLTLVSSDDLRERSTSTESLSSSKSIKEEEEIRE